MDTTIGQQVAMDEALVPYAQRLRIGRSNFRLLSDIKSKESTLQLVYDVLRICQFFKAFLVTADVPEIYMHEFWATTTVHHHAIRFKMDNKKHIINLESFRDMLHICPRVHGQTFAEPPFEEEILAFIHFLKHIIAIRTLTDVNINKLYQPLRSFAVEHKNSKKSNEMYYPRFMKVIIHHFMSKDPSISRRNKVNWHYVRMTTCSSPLSWYPDTKTRAAPPKPKASVRRTRSSSDTSITPLTAIAGLRLTTSAKGKQAAKASKAKSADDEGMDGDGDEEDEGNDGKEGDGDDDDEDDDGKEGNDDDDNQEVERDDDKDDEEEGGDDDQKYDEETRDEESFDPIPKTPENSDVEGNGEQELGLNVGGEESRFNFKRTTLTGFPAQSISSSNAIALDSPNLLVLITGTSQSRQHVNTSLIHLESRKSPIAKLFDVDSGRISIHHCEY
nr:hypothetical protein [Tanacetum cinerariifolium]